MTYSVRFTEEAEADLLRLYDFLLEQDDTDSSLAERALEAIREGLRLLSLNPFVCRKAEGGSTFMRELIIPFGAAGYVALFEIENRDTVTVLALRHQREEDYH